MYPPIMELILFKNPLIYLYLMLLLSGCVSTEGYRQIVSTWINHHTDELITSWGPPSSTTELSDGGNLLQYNKSWVSQSGGYSYAVPRTNTTYANAYGSGGWATGSATTTTYETINVPVSYNLKSCITNFRTSSQSIITDVNFTGNACVAKPIH